MKKMKYPGFFFGALIFAAAFIFTKEFSAGVSRGLRLCAETVIPSLFIFTFAADIAGKSEPPKLLTKFFSPLLRLMKLPPEAFTAVALGLLGGYPVGAKTSAALLSSGRITPEQRDRLLLFCIAPGVGFSVNTVGCALLGSRSSGLIILASVSASALLLGICASFIPGADGRAPSSGLKRAESSLVESVAACSQAMLGICGFVSLFSGIGVAVELLPVSEKSLAVLKCAAEITGGCASASKIMSLPLIAGFCGFGGICVHLQVFSIGGMKTNTLRFMLFRILHGALSVIFCILLLEIFPTDIQALSVSTENAAVNSFSPFASLSLMLLSAVLILELDNKAEV